MIDCGGEGSDEEAEGGSNECILRENWKGGGRMIPWRWLLMGGCIELLR
jgi:hypothetical protein